jgi:hypothetical protein
VYHHHHHHHYHHHHYHHYHHHHYQYVWTVDMIFECIRVRVGADANMHLCRLDALGYVKDHVAFMSVLGYNPKTKAFTLNSVVVRGDMDDIRRVGAREAFAQREGATEEGDSGEGGYAAFEASFLQRTAEHTVWNMDLEKHLTAHTLELCTVRAVRPAGPSPQETDEGRTRCAPSSPLLNTFSPLPPLFSSAARVPDEQQT